MKKEESKPSLKFSKIRGFFIMILGVIFFTSGIVISKRSENKSINSMMALGAVAMLIGAGLQIWEVRRQK